MRRPFLGSQGFRLVKRKVSLKGIEEFMNDSIRQLLLTFSILRTLFMRKFRLILTEIFIKFAS